MGESARSTSGCIVIPRMPRAAIVVNQRTMIGPNIRPTAPVPSLCTAKRTTMIVAVIGTMKLSSDGSITFTPSTAESTEIAGVIMLSPMNSAAPKTPSPASRYLVRGWRPRATWRTWAIRAMIPPSPWLSARMTRRTYLRVTMIVTDQKIRETTPKTLWTLASTG